MRQLPAYVQCVCFPRSGHHLLLNVLLRYFGKDLCRPLTNGLTTPSSCQQLLEAGPLVYCEYYNHCKQTPCRDARTSLQKHHDFRLDLKPQADLRYLVQVRHPLESAVSYYTFLCTWARMRGEVPDDSREGWLRFLYPDPVSRRALGSWALRRLGRGRLSARDVWRIAVCPRRARLSPRLRYWRGFVRKWVTTPPAHPRLVVRFHELIADPVRVASEAIRFLAPEARVDHGLLARVVDGVEVSPQRPLRQFQHYDPNLFGELERRLGPMMRAAGIPAL